jgi:hypothetical protein
LDSKQKGRVERLQVSGRLRLGRRGDDDCDKGKDGEDSRFVCLLLYLGIVAFSFGGEEVLG